MREWEKIIPEIDRQVYNKAQYGKKQPFGRNPALIVVDNVALTAPTSPISSISSR